MIITLQIILGTEPAEAAGFPEKSMLAFRAIVRPSLKFHLIGRSAFAFPYIGKYILQDIVSRRGSWTSEIKL